MMNWRGFVESSYDLINMQSRNLLGETEESLEKI
jgi:hypothetical protein